MGFSTEEVVLVAKLLETVDFSGAPLLRTLLLLLTPCHIKEEKQVYFILFIKLLNSTADHEVRLKVTRYY